VCVYCGSSSGSRPEYQQTARAVGALLGRERITLVYGGSSVGLMGVLADAALAEGGEVIGVIPRGVFRREVAHEGLTRLIEVGSMHERKLTMFELSDAFVGLPGGLGTLEELTEVASWSQLGMHAKPILTLDVDHYWDPFHSFLQSAVDAGFMKAANLGLIGRVDTVDALLPAIRSYSVPYTDKWIEPDQT
jgi:uncharacterized protein (TIGR00730 family)